MNKGKMTPKQAMELLNKAGFNFKKIKPTTTYVEELDGDINLFSDRQIIQMAEEYKNQ